MKRRTPLYIQTSTINSKDEGHLVETITLNNNVEMTILGFGVYQIPDHQQCERFVLDALQTGYRLIDTAAAYMNEEAT